VRQFEDLLRETRTRRLRLRLEEARERFESWRQEGLRGAPQAALDVVKAVQEEAEGWACRWSSTSHWMLRRWQPKFTKPTRALSATDWHRTKTKRWPPRAPTEST
jgi:hypothetical protein